jgi:hypothetical protein
MLSMAARHLLVAAGGIAYAYGIYHMFLCILCVELKDFL